MKFTIIKEPIPFLIIDDTYNKEELIQVYNELDFFTDKFQGPKETLSAELNGKTKVNKGVFLENVFRDRKFSNILQINRKLFNNEVRENLFNCHYAYKLFNAANYDATLLSYYDNGGSYFGHADSAVISIVTWFYKFPKNFTGGEFKFTDYNLDVEVKNNRSVIFFSSYKHEVSEVTLINENVLNSGRFSITNFLSITPI